LKFDDYIRLIEEESKELERIPPFDGSNSDSNSVKELEKFMQRWLQRHNALAGEPLEL
jgi:hypothetical protein